MLLLGGPGTYRVYGSYVRCGKLRTMLRVTWIERYNGFLSVLCIFPIPVDAQKTVWINSRRLMGPDVPRGHTLHIVILCEYNLQYNNRNVDMATFSFLRGKSEYIRTYITTISYSIFRLRHVMFTKYNNCLFLTLEMSIIYCLWKCIL